MNRTTSMLAVAACAFALMTAFAPVDAQTVAIDQAAVMAGNVTPGDAPGFPLTLSRPGRYRLAGDLAVPADRSGIVVSGPGVVLDLDGHRVAGPVRCDAPNGVGATGCDAASRFSAVVGISTVGATGALVRNGSVGGFAGLGVHYGAGTVLEQLSVNSNAGVGIGGGAHPAAGLLRGVRVERNGGPGIVCENLRVESSLFADNAGDGIDCLRSSFRDTVARGNGGFGMAQGAMAGVRSVDNRRGDSARLAAADSAAAAAR